MRKYITKIIFGFVMSFLFLVNVGATTSLYCEYKPKSTGIGADYCPLVEKKEMGKCTVPFGTERFRILYVINGNSFKIQEIEYSYSDCAENDAECLLGGKFKRTITISNNSKDWKILTDINEYYKEYSKEDLEPSKEFYPEISLNENSGCPEIMLEASANKKAIFIYSGKNNASNNYKTTKIDNDYSKPCIYYGNKTACDKTTKHGKFACVWVDNEDYDFLTKGYCNVDNLIYVGCGGASDIPIQVPSLISMLVNLLKIATPIILIFISMITLVKAMSAGKEDEIKKATNSLVKKIIAAALVFFVVAIVQFIVSKVAEDDEYEGFDDCLNCFLNNSCSENMYYKTVINGEDWCTDIATGNSDLCKQ